MIDKTLFGWDRVQWAKVLALYSHVQVGNVSDALRIQCMYKQEYKEDPSTDPDFMGVAFNMDLGGAAELFEQAYSEQRHHAAP
jgi:hypothetical protein